MDLERTESFLPVVNVQDEVEKIRMMKAALGAYLGDHEQILRSVQKRLKDGERQIDLCTRESTAIELGLNIVESKITESLLSIQDQEAETLQTAKENRNIKRKIIALKNDIEQQEKVLRRADETMNAVRKNLANSKKLKITPD